MKAIGTKILTIIEKTEKPVEKAGTFIIPSGNETHEIAKVISIGEEVKGIGEGDLLIIYKGAGATVKIDDQEYRVLTEPDIIAVK